MKAPFIVNAIGYWLNRGTSASVTLQRAAQCPNQGYWESQRYMAPNASRWAVLTEVPMLPVFNSNTPLSDVRQIETLTGIHIATEDYKWWWHRHKERKIDIYAIGLWSKAPGPIAIEVKVSRADFKKELEDPYKRLSAMLRSRRFYFAAPVGLISVAELPPHTGLIEVDSTGNVMISKQTPLRRISDSLRWPHRNALLDCACVGPRFFIHGASGPDGKE